MANYADMKSRIASDLRRTNLSDQIAAKILEAIRHFRDEPWYATESTLTITSVADQRVYSLPSDFSVLAGLVYVTDGSGTRWPMDPKSIDDFDYLDDGIITSGTPDSYTIYASSLYVDPPPPDALHTFDAKYISNLAAPTSDATEGFWMNEAQDVIAHQALGYLWASVIRDPEKAQIEFGLAREEFLRIQGKSEQRIYAAGREVCE